MLRDLPKMELSSEAEDILRQSPPKEISEYRKCSKYITVLLAKSKYFKKNGARNLPKFENTDVEGGGELGRGEYSIVCEITHIKEPPFSSLEIESEKKNETDDRDPCRNLAESEDTIEDFNASYHSTDAVVTIPGTNEPSIGCFNERLFMSRECFRHGIARYALKRIKPDLFGSKKLDAIIDLAIESKFLSVLSHPNIIRMRGMGILPCHSSFFLVLDRLYETLGERIVSWKAVADTNTGFIAKRKKAVKSEKKKLWADRILAAYDIARALRYLHDQRIMYRDLKPENIGFDVRGDAKIFDFGLAKEILESDLTDDDLHKMSGLTGSLRYMAPEVVLCMPYNEKADVFSFGILLWEICALEVPFDGYDSEKHSRRVVRQNERPKMNKSWPICVQDVIKDSWSEDINKRPTFKRISTLLGHEVSKFTSHDEDVLDRSTNMLDSSVSSRRDSMLRAAKLDIDY